MPTEDEEDNSDHETSHKRDVHNMIWLIVMYLIQGIPLGLVFGSLPFLLQKNASYSQLALFATCGYPYSLKLLWSPIVDCCFSNEFGRRKTWIVPIQLIVGIAFIFMSMNIDSLLDAPEIDMMKLTVIFFSVVVLMATQDIAVDGWALTMLPKSKLGYASTCQNVGLNMGYFLSFTIFLALNSVEFCNKYLRSIPQEKGILSVSSYLHFWGWIYILVSLLLVAFKHEKAFSKSAHSDELDIWTVYKQIWSILKLPNMKKLMICLLLYKVGLTATEVVGPLKLMEYGIKKEDMALFALIQFPVMMFSSVLSGKLSKDQPLSVWYHSLRFEMLFSASTLFTIYIISRSQTQDGVEISFLLYVVILVLGLAGSVANTIKFVLRGAFFLKIADKSIGGTYLTLLNTVANFGGTWPSSPILYFVDLFTRIDCLDTADGSFLGRCKGTDTASKQECTDINGSCQTSVDGFYPVAIVCLLFGIGFLYFIKNHFVPMQHLPSSMWIVNRKKAKIVS